MPFLLLATLVGCADEATSQEPVHQSSAAQSRGDDGPLAIVDGVPVTRADLDEFVGDELALLEHQYGTQLYQLLETGVTQAVRQRLLDAEAGRRGVDVGDLVVEEIEAKITVTEADIAAWYSANQSRLQGRPLEMLRGPIRQFLWDEERESRLEEFAAGLAEGHELEPYRVGFEHDGHPTFGPEDAPITLVEFSDFECPYCGGFAATLERAKREYDGQIRLIYRQLPLSQIHPNAIKAGEASLCAEEQGRFWELHDAMFADQASLTVPDLKAKAGQLGLDQAAFDACLDTGKYAAQVDEDLQLASRLGLDGTPALFVNGRPLVGGAVPYEMLAELIDDELERLGR
ncbi:MAG: thioredoxin domain-containing protein [Acidobacteria bacterium]|nr:thioredoxin domain-containing protein [Acidobacteriota bacterium]